MGLASQEHTRSIIFRRESSQTDGLEEAGKQIIGESAKFNGTDKEWVWGTAGRSLKLAGMKEPGDWNKHAGRERDLIGFDEAASSFASRSHRCSHGTGDLTANGAGWCWHPTRPAHRMAIG
jgi:hypothetical protein